jgi:hypothetical protein
MNDLTRISTKTSRYKKFLQNIQIDEKGCWRWQRAKNHKGYGTFKFAGGTLAHRYAFLALKGTIPQGMQIDHLCRKRDCCNPEHLELVTPLENSRRGKAGEINRKNIIKFNASLTIEQKRERFDHARTVAVRKQKERTHCKNGHEYTPESTRYGHCKRPNPYRICKTCSKISIKRNAKALKETGAVEV